MTQLRVAQTALNLNIEGSGDARVAQLALMAHVSAPQDLRVAQLGVMVEGRARRAREESGDNCWELILADKVGTEIAALQDFSNAYAFNETGEPGAVIFTLRNNNAQIAGGNVTPGHQIFLRYRNVDVGVYTIEHIEEQVMRQGNLVDAWTVYGRGLLARLDHSIIYPADLDAYKRGRRFENVQAGGLLIALSGEAELRGAAVLHFEFNAASDALGSPWAETFTQNFLVGDTLLNVCRWLNARGVEFSVEPDQSLWAFQDYGEDRSETVIFNSTNIIKCTRRVETGRLVNAVLVEGLDAYAEATEDASVTSHGRREGLLSSMVSGDPAVLAATGAHFATQHAGQLESYDLEVRTNVHHPFLRYDIGDTIRLSLPERNIEGDFEVLRLGLAEVSGPCDLKAVLNVAHVDSAHVVRMARAMERMEGSRARTAYSSLATGETRNYSFDGHRHVKADIYELDPIDAERIQGRDVSSAAPSAGHIYSWDDAQQHWAPGVVNAVQLQGRDIYEVEPSDEDALVWSATNSRWQPGPVAGNGGGGGGNGGIWEHIGTVIAASDVDDLVLSGISTEYNHFRVSIFAVTAGATGRIRFKLNNDEGSSWHLRLMAWTTVFTDIIYPLGATDYIAGSRVIAELLVSKPTAGEQAMALCNSFASSDSGSQDARPYSAQWNNTTDKITSIGIWTSAASLKIATGSKIIVEGTKE